MAFDWPGNVRELLNTLDRAPAAARYEPTLFPNHLPSYIRVRAVRHAVNRDHLEAQLPVGDEGAVSTHHLPPLREFREAAIVRAEREYLQELLLLAKKDLQEACRLADLSQPRLYALLKKHQISRSH